MMNHKLTVLEMNDSLFEQRRRVINMLYEAKNLLKMDLPRIKVRIVKFETNSTLGLCFINKDYITISEKLLRWSDDYLRHVVWHELGHAYFNARHDDSCPLMNAFLTKPGSKAVLSKALLKLSKKNKSKTKIHLLVGA